MMVRLTTSIHCLCRFTPAQWLSQSAYLAFRMENIPVHDNAKAELRGLKSTHVFDSLPAYDINGDLIMPKDYDAQLRGTIVVLSFTLTHYDFSQRTGSQQSHIFIADIVKIRVLAPRPS